MTPSTLNNPDDAVAARTFCGSKRPPAMLTLGLQYAAIPENVRASSPRSKNSGGEIALSRPVVRLTWDTATRSEDSGYGSGRRRTALTMVNIALFAPMPRPRITSTATVKSGVFR